MHVYFSYYICIVAVSHNINFYTHCLSAWYSWFLTLNELESFYTYIKPKLSPPLSALFSPFSLFLISSPYKLSQSCKLYGISWYTSNNNGHWCHLLFGKHYICPINPNNDTTVFRLCRVLLIHGVVQSYQQESLFLSLFCV